MRRLVLPVFLPTFILSFSSGMLLPILPIYALGLSDSFSMASLAVAAGSVAMVLADLPAGVLIGRLGRKRAMIIGTTAIAISMFGIAFVPSYGALLLFRFIAGLGGALWGVSRMVQLTNETTSQGRGAAMSMFGGVSRMGTFAGPAIGGLIGAVFGLQASFIAAGVLAVVGTILAQLYITPDTREARRPAHVAWSALAGVARTQWRDLLTAGSAQIFAQVIRQGRGVIVPLYGVSVLGLDVAQVGTVISVSSAIDMSLFVPAGLLMDRLGRKFASVPCFAIMGTGMAMIPFAHDYAGLLVAVIVIGAGNGLSSGTMFTLGADLAPPEAAGEFLGLWRLTGDVGQMAGPVVVGAVADAVGLAAAAFALAGVGALSALVLGLFVRETLIAPKTVPISR